MASVRRALAYQHPSAPVRVLADAARPKVKRDIHSALKHLGQMVDREKVATLGKAGRWADVIGSIAWGHFNEILKVPFERLGQLHEDAAQLGVRKINGSFAQRGRRVRFQKDAGGRFNFDRFDEATQRLIRAYQDGLIGQLSQDARDTIEAVIWAGIRTGLPPDEIASDIKEVIGLTDRQALAVLNYRRMISNLDPAALLRQLSSVADDTALRAAIDAGTPLEQAAVDQMTSNYEDNYLAYRAATIAQTETVRAASMGLQSAYAQAIDRGALTAESVTQHWQIANDERLCPVCLSIPDMNPDGVAIGDQFDSSDGPVDGPPIHTNCRCSIEIITNLDLLPTDAADEESL